VDTWVTVGIVVGAIALALLAGPYLAQSMVKGSSSRGTGSFGIVDELFHPVQADASAQVQAQERRRDDVESGDGDDDPELTEVTSA
jgi:hypothetical protein